MFRFFFKKKQKVNDMDVNSLIVTKLDQIIELLEQQQKESSAKSIHIEHVQIDHLENIVFRLDNIEIDDLSGNLVIGNSITSTDVLTKPLILKLDKEKMKKEAVSETSPSQEERMVKTSKGFRFRNNP